MFAHIRSSHVLILLFITTPALSWSIKDSAQNTYSNVTSGVSSWFERSKQEVISKEYPIDSNSTITITNPTGNITITTWNKNSMIIETKKIGREKELPNTVIAIGNQGPKVSLITESLDNSPPLTVNYTIMVPEQASLIVQCEKGNISIKDCAGPINAQTLSGNITIKNSSKDVSAKAPKGSIKLEQSSLEKNNSIFLEAYRNVQLVLSPEIDAKINIKTLSGIITSDFFITLDPITTKLNRMAWRRIKQDIRGTIGSGGAPITIDTTKGNISLLEQ